MIARAMASKASPRTVTMSVNQWTWCPSRFSSEHDLELHLKSFGEEEATHKINWERHLSIVTATRKTTKEPVSVYAQLSHVEIWNQNLCSSGVKDFSHK